MINTETSSATPFKLVASIVLGLLLIACQGESSAQSAATSVTTETVVEASEAAVIAVKEGAKADAIEVAKEKVTETVEAVTEKVNETVNKAKDEVVPQQSATPVKKIPSALDDKSYTVLDSPITVSTGDKIEVTELFWYGCGHCFSLERPLNEWKKSMPANAELVKVPAIFSARWEFHAKAFYTMQSLGVLEQANNAFFQRIHVLRKPINNLDALIEFLADYDKSAADVESAFKSFAVDSNVRNAKLITAKSTATGVPAILVDGKYHTSATLAGSQSGLFTVIDQLVEKAAGER